MTKTITASNRAKYEELSRGYREMWLDGDFENHAEFTKANTELVIEFFGSVANFERDCQDRQMAHYEKAARARERADSRLGR